MCKGTKEEVGMGYRKKLDLKKKVNVWFYITLTHPTSPTSPYHPHPHHITLIFQTSPSPTPHHPHHHITLTHPTSPSPTPHHPHPPHITLTLLVLSCSKRIVCRSLSNSFMSLANCKVTLGSLGNTLMELGLNRREY